MLVREESLVRITNYGTGVPAHDSDGTEHFLITTQNMVGCNIRQFPECLSPPLLFFFNFFLKKKIDGGRFQIKKRKNKNSASISAGGIPACQLFWFLSCFHYVVKRDVKRKERGECNRERKERERERERGGDRHIEAECFFLGCVSVQRQLLRVSVYLLYFWVWMAV